MAEQLFFFQDTVQVIEKAGIAMFRCDKDAVRWVTPHTPCPMCYPTQETAVCDECWSEFEDSRYMLEHQRIGGQVRCGVCLPRVSFDDCRDQNELHREAEDIRLDSKQRMAGRKIRLAVDYTPDE